MAEFIAFIKSLLAAIPILDRWFTKTPTQKIEDGYKQAQDDADHLKETGRPKWH
jgi:hypothetical protein